MNATGIITATYLHTDIISDGNPFPSPSSAPAEVTDTVDTINPALIILNAVSPALIVSGLFVTRPISHSGIARQTILPAAIIANISTIDVLYIFLTLSCSPAP